MDICLARRCVCVYKHSDTKHSHIHTRTLTQQAQQAYRREMKNVVAFHNRHKERTNGITVDGPLVAAAALAAAALATAAAVALAVAPFAPEFDDIAMNDGCVDGADDDDDNNDGVNLKYLQHSQYFIVIACSVRYEFGWTKTMHQLDKTHSFNRSKFTAEKNAE